MNSQLAGQQKVICPACTLVSCSGMMRACQRMISALRSREWAPRHGAACATRCLIALRTHEANTARAGVSARPVHRKALQCRIVIRHARLPIGRAASPACALSKFKGCTRLATSTHFDLQDLRRLCFGEPHDAGASTECYPARKRYSCRRCAAHAAIQGVWHTPDPRPAAAVGRPQSSAMA